MIHISIVKDKCEDGYVKKSFYKVNIILGLMS